MFFSIMFTNNVSWVTTLLTGGISHLLLADPRVITHLGVELHLRTVLGTIHFS